MSHIGDIDYGAVLKDAFPTADLAQEFVACVRAIPASTSQAKIVLHQGARMLWLADQIDIVARRRPAFQILFFVIAAEAIAKIVYSFPGEGQSKAHVNKFFLDICGPIQRSALAATFARTPPGPRLTAEEAVDVLYDVRCDIAHRGRYYEFALREPGEPPMLTPYDGGHITALAGVADLRRIVAEGAVRGSVRLSPPGNTCAALVAAVPALV
jgi:hypothetical protein